MELEFLGVRVWETRREPFRMLVCVYVYIIKCVSNGTSSFISMIFANNSADGVGRAWHLDQDRVKWKKRYLDTKLYFCET